MSYIIPPELVLRLSSDPDFDEEGFLAIHEASDRITSIRINPMKSVGGMYEDATRVSWCPEGRYLTDRPIFTLDPLFHAGCYYVQEASSMFIAHIIRVLGLTREPLAAIDLCAAPGGKSTLLNACLHEGSLLIANEIIKSRAHILSDNLVRWGNANTIVTNNDPGSFRRLPGYADLMIVDAPCSGSGMFRKDPMAIDQWSEAGVKLCSERQQRILADSLDVLKTGGVLLYSTCSYSEEENEEIADWLVETQGMEPLDVPVDESWGIKQTYSSRHLCPGYRFYPHLLKGEGFYIAAFRKKNIQKGVERRKLKVEKSVNHSKILSPWIQNLSDFGTFQIQDDVFIFPKDRMEDLQMAKNVLYLKNAGTRMGKISKNDLIPAHDLSMSNHRRSDIPMVNLSVDDARNYLRKNAIEVDKINIGNQTGWVLASYNGIAIGWMKVMPNRINNYYPKEWRIANL